MLGLSFPSFCLLVGGLDGALALWHLWLWSVAGAAEGPLDSTGFGSKCRTTFCLRPRFGSKGPLQGLCPAQPGAVATGRVLLAGYSVMWFDTHSSPDCVGAGCLSSPREPGGKSCHWHEGV